MLDKLKTFYKEHTMWVNIAGALLLILIGYKIFKKK